MDQHNNSSIFEKAHHPYMQAIAILGAIVVFILGAKLVKWAGILEVSATFPWMTVASFLLFFALFNVIFSLAAKDINKYWTQSIMSFVGLVFVAGAFAYMTSSISINEAGSYKWIFMVVTFGYLVFISIMGMMKTIVQFAEREEWQKPKRRKKSS